ncbi:uncharacterized protein SAPINGB_P003287 [Magnusiomyces paraingens]|uniref:MATE efflux family protein n=1 Tax=Magnusiomyces paraingens TaxID=2606893 RepID=A0A5E8BM59_9ASCO|nr:uncharacterized protein SAPINGB_P003287 [Saprochaete ingens]VVT52011.1 unnamed protein product [Saprochaete ingens]
MSLPVPGATPRRPSETNMNAQFARSPQRDYISFGSVGRPGVFLPSSLPRRSSLIDSMTMEEREELLTQEQDLLADNKLLQRPPQRKPSLTSVITGRRSSAIGTTYGAFRTTSNSSRVGVGNEGGGAATAILPSESAPLLYPPREEDEEADLTLGRQMTQEENEELVRETWKSATAMREITTSYKRETAVLLHSSIPVSLAFLLQYSLVVASVFCVGHIGKNELSAVSVAAMVANICGYGIFQGLATSLDTLATQAFGRKDYEMVGIHTQQCTLIMLIVAIPIAFVWIFSEPIFEVLVPEKELAVLASQYLQVLIIGVPGYIVFEVSKHYLQAQGIFHASTYVLIICAPFNLVLNYVLVWNRHIGLGFVGAPIAVITTDYVMALMSVLYVIYVDGLQCWHGLSKDSLRNWGHMAKLGLAGVLTLETEWLAFEILTFAAARLGTTELATQTVIATLAVLAYQIPLSMGIAASTRVGNLVGAQLEQAAVMASKTYIYASVIFGLLNCFLLYFTRHSVGKLFSSDKDVIDMVAYVMPVTALYQVNDCISAVTGGILRGQGRQKISGYINLILYYVFALPLGLYLAFNMGYGLRGIWGGIVFALFFVSALQIYFVLTADWKEVIQIAQEDDEEDEE